jgi:hypothetical protein
MVVGGAVRGVSVVRVTVLVTLVADLSVSAIHIFIKVAPVVLRVVLQFIPILVSVAHEMGAVAR